MTNNTFTRLAVALALCTNATLASAQTPADPSPKDQLRIQAGGLGTTDWLAGKLITSQGCTMVKLDRTAPSGTMSLMVKAVGRVQAYRAGRWVDVSVAPLLKKEAAHCLDGEGNY
jgi:hypothetical protein